MNGKINQGQWKDYQGIIIPDVPPHKKIFISKADMKEILKNTGAYLIRWTEDFDAVHETEWWYVISDYCPQIEELSPTRTKWK